MRYDSFALAWRAQSGLLAVCWLDLYWTPDDLTVVIATDGGGAGLNVTNSAEELWNAIEREQLDDPSERIVRIESWRHPEGTTWDLVEFTRLDDGSLVAPRWQRLTRVEVESIIGGVVEEPGP